MKMLSSQILIKDTDKTTEKINSSRYTSVKAIVQERRANILFIKYLLANQIR